jgi:hypothetical protein
MPKEFTNKETSIRIYSFATEYKAYPVLREKRVDESVDYTYKLIQQS